MKKKIFLSLIIFLFFTCLAAISIEAGRLLPRFSSGGSTGTKSTGKAVSSGVGASVRLNSSRNGINIYLSNLGKASSVSYMLSYQTDGKEEGAGGTIDTIGQTIANRELLFGTCSSGVCRYHSNITNAKLEITTTLSSGKKTLKRFRIRV